MARPGHFLYRSSDTGFLSAEMELLWRIQSDSGCHKSAPRPWALGVKVLLRRFHRRWHESLSACTCAVRCPGGLPPGALPQTDRMAGYPHQQAGWPLLTLFQTLFVGTNVLGVIPSIVLLRLERPWVGGNQYKSGVTLCGFLAQSPTHPTPPGLGSRVS